MATGGQARTSFFVALGGVAADLLTALGDFTIFTMSTLAWMARRPPRGRVLLTVFYAVGVRSVPVVAVTGMFIGMVMAVQFYYQFNAIGLASRIGAVVNISLVRELGPVLAATMLAGRVGSAMAAELGTMKVTEQVDALSSLGSHPLPYLVVPRLLAAVVLIPLLTVIADFMGIMGGAFICTRFYGIDPHYYWEHAREYVGLWDFFTGVIKSIAFGAVIALIGCHRGLNSQPGAEGVGRAATESFVTSFVVIIILDFFLSMLLASLYTLWWGHVVRTVI